MATLPLPSPFPSPPLLPFCLLFPSPFPDPFRLMDTDCSGTLDKREIMFALQQSRPLGAIVRVSVKLHGLLKPSTFDEAFHAMDTSRRGVVSRIGSNHSQSLNTNDCELLVTVYLCRNELHRHTPSYAVSALNTLIIHVSPPLVPNLT